MSESHNYFDDINIGRIERIFLLLGIAISNGGSKEYSDRKLVQIINTATLHTEIFVSEQSKAIEQYMEELTVAAHEIDRLEGEITKLRGVRMENRRLVKANKKLVAKLKGGKGWPE